MALSTGVTLSYLEQGDKHGAVLILLHGWVDSRRSFDRNLPHLPRQYHVYAIDQRGHGDSDKPERGYTPNDFVTDVVAFMNALNVGTATLIGHSMGSCIAHQFAVMYPHRLDRLVLISSAPTMAGNSKVLELKKTVDGLTDPIGRDFVYKFTRDSFVRPVPQEYFDTRAAETLKVPARVWKQALDGLLAEDHSAQLSKIRARATILYGCRDAFFSPSEEQKLHNLIQRSELRTYEEAGHDLHGEIPERLGHDLKNILD